MNKTLRILRTIFATNLFLLGMVSCSDDNNTVVLFPEPVAYFEQQNVPYGDDSEQVFDIYLPANRTVDTKVMILVHGGGWTQGDKENMNELKDSILLNIPDIAVVNINYRLADANTEPFPMQIDDITAIIDLLQTNKNQYIISDEIGFLGASAGAHLSMLWSYAHDNESQVKMVASIVGPTNFTDPAYLNSEDPFLLELLEILGINTSTEYLEEISPFHQVTSSAPPTILFYGGEDPLVPPSQGSDMEEKLVSLGVTHQFTLYPNEGHGWIGPELQDTWTKIKNFTELHLQ